MCYNKENICFVLQKGGVDLNTGNVKKTYLGGMLTLFMLFSMIILCCLTDNSVYAMTGVSSGDLYADKSSVTMNVAEHSYITVIDTSNRFNGSNGELAVSSTNSSIVYIKSKDFSNSSYSVDLKQSYNNMYLIEIQALAEGEASIRIRNSYGNMLTVPVKVDKMKRTAVFGDSETLKFTYKDEMWSPSPNMLTFDIGGMISYEVDYTDEALMAKLSPDTFDLHINDIEFSAPDGLSFSEDSSAKTCYIVPQSDIVVNLNDKFTVSVPVFAESDYAAEKYASTAAITVTAHTDAGTFSHSYGVNIFDDRKRGSVNPDPDAYSGKCIVVTASSINSTKDLVVSEGEDVVVKGDVSCNNLYVNGGTLTICSKSTLNVIGNAVVSGGSTNWLNPISTDKCGGVLEVNGKLKVGNDLTVSEPCGILNMRNSGCSVTVMNNFLITTNSTTYTCTLTEGTLSVGGKFEASGKYSGNFKASQNHLTVLSGNSFDVVMDKSDSHFNHLALSDEAYSSFTSGTEKELYSANIKGRFYKLSDKNSDLTKYLSDNNPVLRQLDETYNNYMGKSDFKDNMSSLKKYVSSEFFDKIVADTMFFCDMENMAIATNSSESGLNFAQWFTDISFVAYFNNGNTVLEMNAPNEPTVYVCVAWLGQSIGSKKSTVSASLFNVRYIVDCGNDKYITGDRVCTLSFKDLDNLGNSLVEIYKDTTNTNGTIDDYLTWFKKYVLASYSDMNTIFNAATGTNGKLDLTDINVLTNLTQKTYKAIKNKNLGSFAIKSPADVSKLPKKITTFLSSDKSAWDIATLISCPVNVVVKDSTGAIVAYVFNNKVKVTSDEADISVINGDQKYIRFSSIDDYTLELTGTDSGTMSYYVYECDSDEINRSFCADNIPLTDGIKYTGKVDSITDCSAEDFSLSGDSGKKYTPSSDGGSSSDPETDYNQFSYTISNGEVKITGYKGKDTVIKIPSKIEGYPVTSISNSAFSGCKRLTSIIIPDSVTSVGYYAFSGCTNLETITIPKNATFSGSTFDDCISLKNVKFSSGIEKIPDYLFRYSQNLNSLTSITIPGSVTTIGSYAFYYCTGLTSVTIPDSVTTIGGSAFSGCKGLTSVTIPDSVTTIGSLAFSGCKGLTSVTIPDSVTSMGSSAFSGCTNLETITIPKNATFSGSTFDDCISLKNVKFSSGIEKIPSNLFYESGNLNSLTSITIPDSVTTIGGSAFSSCTGLTSIIIPDSVTTIGSSAFSGCTNLETITIPKNAQFSSNGYTFDDCTSLKKVIFSSEIEKIPDYLFYKSSNLNSLPSNIIPNSVTTIGNSAFGRCTGLTSISIPDSVTTIGSSAFSSCTNLETIAIPKNAKFDSDGQTFDNCTSLKNVIFSSGIEKIPDYLFYKSSNLNSLTSITIPDSVTSVGRYAFNGCTNLETITIPKNALFSPYGHTFDNCTSLKNVIFSSGIEKIPDYLFYESRNLNSLPSITIPDSVTAIGNWAFFDCTSLTSVTIPDGVTSIGEYAFYGCTGLTSITISDSVTSISEYAFYGCTGLTGITIPDSVTSIGDYAFRYCTGLTSITIPDSVTSIGGAAFYGCTGLTSVTIPDSVTTIDNWVFNGCTGLTSITISDSVTTIGSKAFYDCTGLTSITIPDSVTTIGSLAFSGCTSLETVTIPKNAKFDSYGCTFNNCTSLKNVIFSSGIEKIPDYLFYKSSNLNSLTSITIPNSVTSIGYIAFNGCIGLTSMTIPNSVTSIGSYAFANCTGLTSMTIPNSVTSIGSYAFANCTGLTNITIPDSVTAIGGSAFYGCTNLETITIPKNSTFGGGGTFDNCTSLKNVKFSIGIEKIPNYLFYQSSNLNNLTSITIPDSVTSVGYRAFSGCTGLTSITIPDSVTTIGSDAFSNCTNLTIYCYPNSYAETYAKSNNIPYKYLEEKPKTSITPVISVSTVQVSENAADSDVIAAIRAAAAVSFGNTNVDPSDYELVITAVSGKKDTYTVSVKLTQSGSGKYTLTSDGAKEITVTRKSSEEASKPVITAANAYDCSVDLEWTAVSGAEKYAVYYTVGGKWYNAGTTTELSMTVTGLTGAIKYGFAVKAYVNNAWTGIASADIVYAIPTSMMDKAGITSIQLIENGTLRIGWSPISGAEKYAFYYIVDGKWHTVGTTTERNIVVTNLKDNVKYGFAIKGCINGLWTEIRNSDIVYYTPDFSKPYIIKAEPQDGKVALNWISVDGATQYAVYYTVGGKWYNAGTTTALGKYVTGLTGGTKYGFAVKAYVNGAWTGITSSDIVYATPVGSAAVVKPKITKAQGQDGKVALNWTAVDGATNYAVYSYLNGKWSVAGYRTATGMYVTGLTNGTKYGFAVKAYVNGAWTGITSSDIVYATPVGSAAVKPVITKAQGQDGRVALNWTAVDGATNYAVYTYLNGKWSVAGYRTATGMYVTGLTNGTRYGFAVKAYVNGAWTSITSSDIVYAAPTAAKSEVMFDEFLDFIDVAPVSR